MQFLDLSTYPAVSVGSWRIFGAPSNTEKSSELTDEDGHRDQRQKITAESNTHTDREDFYISAGTHHESFLMTYTSVNTKKHGGKSFHLGHR